MAMLEVRDLRTSFFTPAGEVKAVNGISFDLESGKVRVAEKVGGQWKVNSWVKEVILSGFRAKPSEVKGP